MKDHLGNVRAVVSDVLKPSGTATEITALTADVMSATDYYPFGSIMPGRNFSSNVYRFGYGSHEKIDELSGSGNTIDMGDRWLDTRIGRTPKMDAKASKYPDISPYSYAANNPVYWLDPDGKDLYACNDADRKLVNGSTELVLGNAQSVFSFNEEGKLVFNKNYDPSQFTSQQNLFIKEFNDNIVSNSKVTVYVHNSNKGENASDGKNESLGKFEPEKTLFDDDITNGNGVVDLYVNPSEKSQAGVLFDETVKTEQNEYDKNNTPEQKEATNKKDASKLAFWHGIGHAIQFAKGDPYGSSHERRTVGFENFVRKIVNLPQRTGADHGDVADKETRGSENYLEDK